MKKESTPENDAFIKAINLLSERGVKNRVIAEKIDVHPQKIANIKRGGSSADIHLLNALYNAYPEIAPKSEEDYEPTVKEMLKELLFEIKEIRKDLQQGEKRADTIDRLAKLLDEKASDKE